ncbi:MAG: Twin-arginine translocation pathway signal sequence domain-containing protein, partial [Reyranella sp.]|nr:Twin-arginine translocation pathway signal sequence domain-containing protein [Reyranella sp.]
MGRVLLLVELKGGNDGLNTVIPYADAKYHELRPGIAVARDHTIHLDEKVGLHNKLEPLMEAWKAGDLAIVQGVGYPYPNRSHFRSIE